MINRNSAFFSLSKTIAENFLQTAIIVDDQANFEPSSEQVTQLTPPGRRSPAKTSAKEINSTDSDETNGSSHLLNAKAVIESFAEKGIICSVIKPDKNDSESLTTTLLKLATSADIIILDWELNDKGQQVLQFIENIITNNDTPHQLRLIVVYTGEPDIVGIMGKIQAHLQEKSHSPTHEETDNLSLEIESVRIAIFAKPETKVASHFAYRRIQFSKLADTVTQEFTMMTAGLVSNVVMESLAQVRKEYA